jgi:hypothetical protein
MNNTNIIFIITDKQKLLRQLVLQGSNHDKRISFNSFAHVLLIGIPNEKCLQVASILRVYL